MTTSNKNFLFKRDRSRNIVNGLITSNANYKYRLTINDKAEIQYRLIGPFDIICLATFNA